MAELRDLYDRNSNKTDKTYHKGEPIPDGYYPMVVMVVIRNSKGEFLMQKRVPKKGGDWGVTGGHPKAGETPREGILTEVKEELGLDFSKETFIEYDAGCDGKDCYKMYFVTKNIDLKDIKIQKEELSDVRWFSMEELKKMVHTKELNEDQIACFQKVCNYLEKNQDKALLFHMDEIHTTEGGRERIRKHLELDPSTDVIEYCKNKILKENCMIYKKGKNWYCDIDGIQLTIHSSSYTIITAHKKEVI